MKKHARREIAKLLLLRETIREFERKELECVISGDSNAGCGTTGVLPRSPGG